MPKVSIITAAYNHVGYIRQSVESVLAQTFKDYEHIVIDDGSSDGTADILKSYGDKITYIRQDNRGAHAAINTGIRMASGEYIAIIDSDDAWLPHKLERQMYAFDEFPWAGMIYSQVQFIDSEGNLKNKGEPVGWPVSNPRQAFTDLLRQNPIPVLTAVFRRSCVESVGFFDESLKAISDWDMWVRISTKWPIVFIPEILALYRDHGNNTWHRLLKNGRVDRERLIILDKAYKAHSENTPEERRSKELVGSILKDMALRTIYGHWYHYRYSAAMAYLLFALKLHPELLKDGLLALEPRLIPRLIFGVRSTEAIRSIKHLL